MRFKGKIIGCLMGLLCLGPIGAAFGFIAGHLYDIGYFRAFIDAAKGGIHTHTQKVFFENTFKIMGYIAKSDGHVSQSEIDTARNIMRKMHLNAAMQQQAIALFNTGKQPHFNIDQSLAELRQVCHTQPVLLRLFLDIQWEIAGADGSVSAAKKRTLQTICDKLGLQGFHEHNYSQHHTYEEQRYSHHRQRFTRASDAMTLNEAYQLLEITASANNDEVKKAYRRMMSQHHPDKLMSKGLPPEMIKMATQKTQQIKKAYEEIKKSRGL